MANAPMKFDLNEVVDGLKGMVSSVMGSASKLGTQNISSTAMRVAVMSVLKGDAKNGKEVIQAIKLASGNTLSPKSSEIYPLLEELTDEGLLAIKIEKELRVYSLTKAGKAALADALASTEEKSDKTKTINNNWLEMNTTNIKAGAKLAQALAQVAQHGTPDQQKRVVELVDETRRKVYSILAED